MTDYLSDKIRKLNEYIPNESAYRVRLDANESPFRPSDTMMEKFSETLKSADMNRYPDPYAKELISKYAAVYNIDPRNLIVGNGSDELISIICNSFLSKGDKILCLYPDFSMYAFYSELIEADIVRYDKPDGYGIDFDELKQIIKDENINLVMLSNPCNPTGVAYERDVILDFVGNIGCLAVIDEAYMEYCTRDCSILHEYKNFDNLIILKTLSKIGYAGLRLGFAIGCDTLIGGIRKVKSPYNVNMISQILASVMLDNYGEVRNNIDTIIKNREVLYNKLVELQGLYSLQPPDGNFISLVFGDGEKAEFIYTNLIKNGISVRYMKPYRLRITVGTAEENNDFIKSFGDLI